MSRWWLCCPIMILTGSLSRMRHISECYGNVDKYTPPSVAVVSDMFRHLLSQNECIT